MIFKSRRADEAYKEWLIESISVNGYEEYAYDYSMLLDALFNTTFVPPHPEDTHHSGDGITLRDNFANIANLRYGSSDEECTFLEAMVDLAFNCENIIYDYEKGDQTGRWFWDMIFSLGLSDMTNNNYDENRVRFVIDRFYKREYSPNGEGGLFTVHNPKQDFRDIPIWMQMHRFLIEVVKYE